MKFSYRWLRELAKFGESPKALSELLSARAFEVESVGAPARSARTSDWALDIALLPNRAADASGHVGMAREIAHLKGTVFRERAPKIRESGARAASRLSVGIADRKDAPRYTTRVMSGVRVGPSPAWLRDRLLVCGLQSINNVVDAANYVMLELGQPLHAFDAKKIRGRIAVRRAAPGESITALDGSTYRLDPEILVIADDGGPIAVAGIKGGSESGVSPSTTELILESANFAPERVRIGSQRLQLKTDASWRFERGLDPHRTAMAVDRLAELTREVAGGEVLAGRVDVFPAPPRARAIPFRPAYAADLIGAALPPSFAARALARIGCRILRRGSAAWAVIPPTDRLDLAIEEDLIEEIVRQYGPSRIAAAAPRVPLAAVRASDERTWRERIRDLFAAAGFTEAYAYHFTGARLLDVFGARTDTLPELENPLSADATHLAARPSLRFAAIAAENQRHADRVALFGIARGFEARPSEDASTPIAETDWLVAAVADKRDASPRRSEAFFSLKGAADEVLERLGVTDHWYDADGGADASGEPWRHPARSARIMADGKPIGSVFELHPASAARLKARGRIALLEVRLRDLIRAATAEYSFAPPPRFPAIMRDIALIVPADVRADDVEEIIEASGGALLEDTDLFDYFEDDELARDGRKSLAFRLVFRSPDRTLEEREAAEALRRIRAAAEARGWHVK